MMRSISPTLLFVVLALGCGGAAVGGGGGGAGGGRRGGFDPESVPTQSPLAITRETGPDGAAALRVGDALIYDVEVTLPQATEVDESVTTVTRVDGAFQYRVLFDSGERWEVSCAFESRDETRRRSWSANRDQGTAECWLRRGDVLSPTFALQVATTSDASLTTARLVDGTVTPSGLPGPEEAERMSLEGSGAVPVLTIQGSGDAWGFALSMRDTTYADGSEPETRDVPVEDALVGSASLRGQYAMRYRDGLDASIRSLVGVAGSVLLVIGHAQPIARPPVPVRGNGTSSSPVTAVSVADEGLCALHADGAVICRNGDGDPFQAADADVNLMATAGEQLCLRMTDGSLRCGPREPHDTLPPRVLGAEGSASLTMTDEEHRLHVCRLDSAGNAGCFGDLRLFGLTHTLGLDDMGLVPVPEATGAAQLVLRGGSCNALFARTSDGSVRVTAREACNGEGLDQRTSEQLDGAATVSGVSDLAVGPVNACAIHSNGKVACWGEDLAWGSASSLRESSTPTDVEGVRDAVQLAVGWGHACARTRSGHVTCWGGNVHGSLGDGSARTRLSARVIPGLANVSSLAASNSVTCAVSEGALMCWGEEVGPDGEDARSPTRQAL